MKIYFKKVKLAKYYICVYKLYIYSTIIIMFLVLCHFSKIAYDFNLDYYTSNFFSLQKKINIILLLLTEKNNNLKLYTNDNFSIHKIN